MSEERHACALPALSLAAALALGSLHAGAARADAADAIDRPAAIVRLAAQSLLLDVARLPGGRLVCVGERGHVLVSDDGGEHWTQRETPTRATLTRVYFLDDKRGYAVGHDEVILRTQDGGATWTRSHYEPGHRQPLFDVWFSGDGTGLAVGAYSTVLRSLDFGATWSVLAFAPQSRPTPAAAAGAAPEDADIGVSQPHLYALRASGTGHLYLAAEAGHLYRSDDRGQSWRELPSPYGGTFFGVLPLDGDSLLAFGLRGHLHRSDDGGQTFTALESGTTDLLAAATRLGDGGVAIAGLSGVVLVSSDGRRFRAERQPDRRGFSGIAAVGETLVLVGEAGVREVALAVDR